MNLIWTSGINNALAPQTLGARTKVMLHQESNNKARVNIDKAKHDVIAPVFSHKDLVIGELIQKCLHEQTRNVDESLNCVIWICKFLEGEFKFRKEQRTKYYKIWWSMTCSKEKQLWIWSDREWRQTMFWKHLRTIQSRLQLAYSEILVTTVRAVRQTIIKKQKRGTTLFKSRRLPHWWRKIGKFGKFYDPYLDWFWPNFNLSRNNMPQAYLWQIFQKYFFILKEPHTILIEMCSCF